MSDDQRLHEALGEFARRFGITSILTEQGEVLAEAPLPQAELAPCLGHGDTVSRGDLIRVYFSGDGQVDLLEHDSVRVNDYDGDWMNVLAQDGDIHSFAFGNTVYGFSRRLELLAPS